MIRHKLQRERYEIVLCYEHPPIPIRAFDWCAYERDQAEAGNYGWGATPLAALEDFLDKLTEQEEDNE